MLHKISVPIGFTPSVWCFWRGDRSRWIIEYFLPSEDKIKIILTLPRNTTETKAKSFAKRKESDLAKGLLTNKEYLKLSKKNSSGEDWTISQAVKEYTSTTAIYKSPKQREKEVTEVPCRFKFFEKNFKIKMIQQITESHLIDYRNHLIKQVNAKEIAPASAQTFMATVKKVFNWLEENKKILINPAKNLKPIKVQTENKVRSNAFTPDQIFKVMQADYNSDNGFPIKAFFLFARETGARLGEILHLEWNDIKDGVWHIKTKANCPTKYHQLGWSPKWGKERKIFLSPTALSVLESIPKVSSVGYQKNNPTPFPANFIFVVHDHKSKVGWRRTDQVTKTWKGLLKAAGLPYEGPDCFIRHDLRRTWNVEAQNYKGIDEIIRSQQLGHSLTVNQKHYSGIVDDEMLRVLTKLKSANGDNLIPFIQKERLKNNG